ncbi:hypothetical protein [Streptomyces sp. Isolate_219]|uniref:hypothetical protein n=1 Tax=Streptomyces sp. Isolate_219 TaxID=2950110 RepID=UPI0021C56724|nr:hypothetical protein [Streptomyces sp. Isolate_219]MCR8576460.1 hypothetical protein [Streptomyces sp. Isolate_219]
MAAIDRVIGAAVDSVKKSGVLEAGALMATVSVVNSDGTVTVTRGDDTYPKVRLLSGYRDPAAGDTVQILKTTGGWVCVGELRTTNPNTWTTLTLAANWSPFGGAYGAPSYRVNGDGTVSLSGMAGRSPTIAAPSTVLTLPVAIRPPFKQRFVTQVSSSAYAALDVNTDGTVVIGDYSGNAGWASLEPARYRIL